MKQRDKEPERQRDQETKRTRDKAAKGPRDTLSRDTDAKGHKDKEIEIQRH